MTNPAPFAEPRHATLVFRGGIIRPLTTSGFPVDSQPAQAVAVVDGVIAAVGGDAEIEAWIGPETRVIELDGRAVIPGINDSHLHGAWLGARWPHTFFGAADPEAAAAVSGVLLASREERRAAILRAGEMLSEVGITSYTEPGIGPGEDAGETGCFGPDVLEAYRELAAEGLLRQRVGVLALYGILDGPSNRETVLAGIATLAASRGSRVGVGGVAGVASGAGAGAAGGAGGAGGAAVDPRFLSVPGIKIFGDLIPLSRQAWTAHEYDDGSHGGLLVEGDTLDAQAADLAAMVRAGHLAGLQVGVHATGDQTIQLVLDAIAEAETEAEAGAAVSAAGSAVGADAAATAPSAPSARELGHSIIHGDLVTEAQVWRMAELGVWLNAQAGIAAITGEWLAGMMGQDVARVAWPFGAAADAEVLLLSSDAPVLGFDWRRGIADADARIVAGGAAIDPAASRDRLHRLLRGYTALPAKHDRAAAWKGTVEVGKVADLVVLGADPFAVGAAGLVEVTVDATVLDGRVVYER